LQNKYGNKGGDEMKNTVRWIIIAIAAMVLIAISFLESARKPVAEVSPFGKTLTETLLPVYLEQIPVEDRNSEYAYLIFVEKGSLIKEYLSAHKNNKIIRVGVDPEGGTAYIFTNSAPDEKFFKEIKQVNMSKRRYPIFK
jgi:hypothetical protein